MDRIDRPFSPRVEGRDGNFDRLFKDRATFRRHIHSHARRNTQGTGSLARLCWGLNFWIELMISFHIEYRNSFFVFPRARRAGGVRAGMVRGAGTDRGVRFGSGVP
jgi:hypothetical protein